MIINKNNKQKMLGWCCGINNVHTVFVIKLPDPKVTFFSSTFESWKAFGKISQSIIQGDNWQLPSCNFNLLWALSSNIP